MVLPCHRHNSNLYERPSTVALLASLMHPAPEARHKTAARGNQFYKPDGSFIYFDPSSTPRDGSRRETSVDTRSLIAGALGILLALDVHECFHAWVADQLGDPTARYMGRISLNPIVHLDPLGTMMMLFAAFSGRGIGWGKPVPVNPRNLRYGPRVGMGIVSFAGPFANLVTASLIALPLRLRLSLPGTLSFLLMQVMFINIGLAIFNLIPLPPLDGYGVLQGILASIRGPT
ncbi:MAG: site-2 protease family protein, partial [Chloroflexi bacterium]|nr:site-2 protease family protein [Chloroflexota bacterium]